MKRCGIYFFVLIALFVTVSPVHAMLRRSELRMWNKGSPLLGGAINAALHRRYQNARSQQSSENCSQVYTHFANDKRVPFLFSPRIDQQYADALRTLDPHPYFAATELRRIGRTDTTELFAVRNIEKGELLCCVVGVLENGSMSVLGVSESDHVPVSSGFGPGNVIFQQWVTERGDVLTVCVADRFIAQGEQVSWGFAERFWNTDMICIASVMSFALVLLQVSDDVSFALVLFLLSDDVSKRA